DVLRTEPGLLDGFRGLPGSPVIVEETKDRPHVPARLRESEPRGKKTTEGRSTLGTHPTRAGEEVPRRPSPTCGPTSPARPLSTATRREPRRARPGPRHPVPTRYGSR